MVPDLQTLLSVIGWAWSLGVVLMTLWVVWCLSGIRERRAREQAERYASEHTWSDC